MSDETTVKEKCEKCEKFKELLTDFGLALRQLHTLQDEHITWSICPQCGRIVAMKGIPCLIGNCKCGYIVMESEIVDVNIDDVLEEWYQRMR